MGNLELCEAALKAIAEARAKGCNVLTADIAMSGLSDWHVPVVETVTLDSDPKQGDIYPQGEKFAISRQALSKLAVAAGVIWSASETRRTDNRACRDYVSFQAVGGIQKPDGTYTFMKSEYDLDMEVVEEDLINIHTATAKKFKKDQAYIDFCVKRDIIQKRKHKLKLCESGAKDRVIRELLGIKATYPMEQIRQPFVILRITVRPDYTDKDVKRAMLAAAIQSMTGIYGAQIPAQIPYEDPIDVTEVSHEDEAPEPGQQVATTAPAPGPGQPPFDLHTPETPSPLLDFKNSDVADQARTLESLAKRKGYDLVEYLKRAAATSARDLKADTKEKLFSYLITLPDKGKEAA